MAIKIIKIFIVIILFFSLNINSYGYEENKADNYANEIGEKAIEKIPYEAKEFLYDLDIENINITDIAKLSPKDFFKKAKFILTKNINENIKNLSLISITVIICAVIINVGKDLMNEKMVVIFDVISVITISSTVINPIINCIKQSVNSINQCADFMTAQVPIFASLVTVSGNPMSASTYNFMLMIAANMVSQIVTNIILPILMIFLSFIVVGSAFRENKILNIAKTFKNISSWILGIVLSIFVGILSLQSFVGTAADNVSIRAAKFMIGSFVPVIGSSLSEAFNVTKSFLVVIKSTVGMFGIIIILVIFLPILIKIFVWYFITKISSFVGDMLGVDNLKCLLSGFGDVLMFLMLLILTFALISIIGTALLIMIGTGLG